MRKISLDVFVDMAVCFGCGVEQVPEVMTAQVAHMGGYLNQGIDADDLVAGSTRLQGWSHSVEVEGHHTTVQLCPACTRVAARAVLEALDGRTP